MFILLTQHITLVINGTPLDCKAFPENWRYVSAVALLPRRSYAPSANPPWHSSTAQQRSREEHT